MANDATIEDAVLEDLQQQSVQARARSSPWDSSSAPGIGPGFEGAWWGGGTLFLGLQQAADEIIQWGYYPMRRDRQMRNFWKTEAILSGGVYSFSARISALPAKINGPPRNKAKATDMLHALDLQKLVIDMLTTDNGFFIERVGPGRPDKPLNPRLVSYLSAMDSQQIWRTFDPEYPVIYINPYTGQYHKMHYSRVITGSSCPQPDELARGIGFCAVSRCLRFCQIERDIEIFKHEKVGGRFTRALGTVSGMTPGQFNSTIDASKEVDDANGYTRYRGIPWLVSVNQEIKANIIDLAHLPDGFDAKTDTDTYVNVLALAFGTDVREFWPGQGSGATKADATVQHEKARGKGIADVTSTIERALNWGVLDALGCEVEFDYTDDAEQMATAQYHFQVITNVATMQQAGNINTKQGTALLVNAGVIDPEVIENVQEAESAEPADTESPYTEEDIPVQETAQPAQQGPPQLAKPPAPANTTPTPSAPVGGIKPPPPRMQTSDMKPARKAASARFASDDERKAAFANMANPGASRLAHIDHVSGMSVDDFRHYAEAQRTGVAKSMWSQGLVGYSPTGDVVPMVKDSMDASEPRSYRAMSEAAYIKNGDIPDRAQAERIVNAEYANHAGAVLAASKRGNVKLTEAQTRRLTQIAQGKYLDTIYSQHSSGDRGTMAGRTLSHRADEGSLVNRMDRRAEFMYQIGRSKAASVALQRFHDRTNAYQDRLKGIMQDFFDAGTPTSDSDLESRLADLKANYLTLANSGLNAAFNTGIDHGSKGTHSTASALGQRKLKAVKDRSHAYFDGLLSDLRSAVKTQMSTKERGSKSFGDLASGFVNRIGQYAGHFWEALHQGIGDFLRQTGDNQEVERHLDPEAEHCSTCPDKAGVYPDWETMANSVGVPGDGSDECGSNCRCTVSWGMDVSYD